MDIDVTFSQARELARQGDRPAARRLLEEILQDDPDNEEVLLWYALVSPTKTEAVDGLRKVLEINPNNAQAQQRLAKLQADGGVPASTPSNSTPFSYDAARGPENAAPAFTAVPVEAAPSAAGAASPALLKRLDHLITLQEHMDQQINKINRVAQFFFWLTIIGIVLSLISTCLAISGVLPLLGFAS